MPTFGILSSSLSEPASALHSSDPCEPGKLPEAGIIRSPELEPTLQALPLFTIASLISILVAVGISVVAVVSNKLSEY